MLQIKFAEQPANPIVRRPLRRGSARPRRARRGLAAIEYALLLSLVSVLGILSIQHVGGASDNVFRRLGQFLVAGAGGKGNEDASKGKEANGKGKEDASKGKEANGKGKEANGKGKEANGKGKEANGKGKEANGKGKGKEDSGNGNRATGNGKEAAGNGNAAGGKPGGSRGR